jgi:hypothetical protein
VAFHLKQLESLLLPTQTTKMSLWTLEQASGGDGVIVGGSIYI